MKYFITGIILFLIYIVFSGQAFASKFADEKYECLAYMSTYEYLHPDDRVTALNKTKLEFVMKLQNRFDISEFADYVENVDESAGEESEITKSTIERCNKMVDQYTKVFNFSYGLK